MFGCKKFGLVVALALVSMIVISQAPMASAAEEADLWVQIGFSPDVTIGLPLTLYFLVGNQGGSTAQDVDLCITLPSAPWAVETAGCTLDIYLGPVGPGELRSAIFTLLPQRFGHWRADAQVETSSPEGGVGSNWYTLNLIIFDRAESQIFLPLVVKT